LHAYAYLERDIGETCAGENDEKNPGPPVTGTYLKPIGDGHLMRLDGRLHFKPKDQVVDITCGKA